MKYICYICNCQGYIDFLSKWFIFQLTFTKLIRKKESIFSPFQTNYKRIFAIIAKILYGMNEYNLSEKHSPLVHLLILKVYIQPFLTQFRNLHVVDNHIEMYLNKIEIYLGVILFFKRSE